MMITLSPKRIGLLLIGICFNLLLFAQSSQIFAGISGDSLVFYNINTNEAKFTKLSNSSLANQGARSMIFNETECVFYVITETFSTPKLHRISLSGEVSYVGLISFANGDPFYRCDAIAYNSTTKKAYISTSIGPNSYTKYISEINLSNASCKMVSEIENGSKETSDADYLAFYNNTMLIGDIFSNTIFSYIYALDIHNAKGVSTTKKLFETDANFQFTEMAIIGDSVYAFFNNKMYAASISNPSISFSPGRVLSIKGLKQGIKAITCFPHIEYFSPIAIMNDTVLCKNDSILVNASNYTNFVWNDGIRKNPRWIKNEGEYFGTADKAGCSFKTAPFNITKMWCNKCDEYYEEIKDKLTLGEDIVLCTNKEVQWSKNNMQLDSILWSDGDNSFDKSINTASTLFATYYRDTCTYLSDTVNIEVTECLDCVVQFPTAFTPNGDHLNDVFQPIYDEACELTSEQFVVYNRWGQIIFEDTQAAWDGAINGALVPAGIYIYQATLFNTRLLKRIVLKGTLQVHY